MTNLSFECDIYITNILIEIVEGILHVRKCNAVQKIGKHFFECWWMSRDYPKKLFRNSLMEPPPSWKIETNINPNKHGQLYLYEASQNTTEKLEFIH